jgi:beta-glucanase (GH16 family)
MLFHDEFDGNSLDTSKWNTCFFNFHVAGTQDCTHDQSELELYQPANVTVNNGILNLTAQKQNVTAGGQTYHYTSGMISSGPATNGAPAKFSFQYGYMEMRAEVPAGQGLWPAFWTLAADESYPPEIDIFEILGNATTVDNMHYHYPDGSDEGADVGSEWTGPNFSAGWHTFAVDWEPGSLTWYVDGVARFHTSNKVTSKPQYLVANLAVGGGWPGNPDATTPFPSSLQIDYIRVWQKG